MTALTASQQARLATLEAIVERGLDTFVQVGLALAEIRDARLYKQRYGTFEAYCRERWGFSRSRGYRLIRAAELASLSPTGDIQNERQARAVLEPGATRDIDQRLLTLAFGLDPNAALPASVETLWRHAGRRPPSLEEAVEAAETTEEKIAILLRYHDEIPPVAWKVAGGALFDMALEETGADREWASAVFAEIAAAATERLEELEHTP